MRLIQADAELNQKMCQFYSQFTLPGMIEMRMTRKEDFFLQYKTHSKEFESLCLMNEKNEIQGLASFVFRETFFEGHTHRIALAQDLRISNSRDAIVGWSNHFVPQLERIYKEKNLTTVFSIINRLDQNVYNLFIRPRSLKRPMPRYYLYRNIKLVSLHGRYPWAPKSVPGLFVEKAEATHTEELVKYLSNRANFRAFSTIWDKDSFEKRLAEMRLIEEADFFVARDSNTNIVGCLCVWSTEKSKDYIPLSYSLPAHNFRQFLKFGHYLGWTRRLTKPLSRTGLENPLRFRFINHIHSQNEDILDSLLMYAFNSISKDEFLVYSHCDQDFRLKKPLGWIGSSHPYALYCVLPPQTPIPHFLKPGYLLNPELETSFLF